MESDIEYYISQTGFERLKNALDKMKRSDLLRARKTSNDSVRCEAIPSKKNVRMSFTNPCLGNPVENKVVLALRSIT